MLTPEQELHVYTEFKTAVNAAKALGLKVMAGDFGVVIDDSTGRYVAAAWKEVCPIGAYLLDKKVPGSRTMPMSAAAMKHLGLEDEAKTWGNLPYLTGFFTGFDDYAEGLDRTDVYRTNPITQQGYKAGWHFGKELADGTVEQR